MNIQRRIERLEHSANIDVTKLLDVELEALCNAPAGPNLTKVPDADLQELCRLKRSDPACEALLNRLHDEGLITINR